MRGQVVLQMIRTAIPRITPADAGTSRPHPARAQRLEDHPRGCGDKSIPMGIGRFEAGSPPRMRGQELPAQFDDFREGITPADAGTSTMERAGLSATEDHPRGCGDKSYPTSWMRR